MEARTLKLEPSQEYKDLKDSPIAFFCAEYAFNDHSSYAGGLGILASDFVLEASDQGLPFIAIGLWYGGSKDEAHVKEFSVLKEADKPVLVEVPCGEEIVKAGVWVQRFGQSAVLLLLDTNNLENSPEDQAITDHLYETNLQYRLKQGVVLGIGGVRLLSKLGIKPKKYHLNEGHTAFAALELLAQEIKSDEAKGVLEIALAKVKERVAATKHTIFSFSGEVITKDHLASIFCRYSKEAGISVDDIFKLGENKNDLTTFSTTQFLLNCAGKQNGVSVLHTIYEKTAHPASILFPITNGVYAKRWQADFWRTADHGEIPQETIWSIKNKLRARLVNFIKEKTGKIFDPEACTVVWARRITAYKQPELLFSDLGRLEQICSGENKVQFIISGKAHMLDVESLKSVEKIKAWTNNSAFKNKTVYIEDYSVTVATELVFGADVWLNTPKRGFEACGTSGMKAGLNGALQASVSDGWMDEVDWSGIGFILPETGTAEGLYNILENDILPTFYSRKDSNLPSEWVRRSGLTRDIIKAKFTTNRMVKDYITKVYLPL